MRKRLLTITAIILSAIFIAGCGGDSSADVHTIPFEKMEPSRAEESQSEKENTTEENTIENNITEENVVEESVVKENVVEENTITETEVTESADLTFADLAERQFGFSSGAGGWSEEFTIEKDGYFMGNYRDSDMGDIGEGYEGGTMYCSSYSGHFTDLIKVDDYTYTMKLADISYKENAEAEKIVDNVRYIYTEAYCLGGTDIFTIYLPGKPLGELSEDVRMWISSMNQSETELSMIAIADETNGYGIYSYERLEPLKDAQTTYDDYKYSYDYYSKKLSEASTTAEMVEYSGNMYEISDECLNYIWNLIRYNVDEDKYDEILAEQRAWIAEKEAKAKEAGQQYEGGSFAAVSYNDTLATLTIKRCEELIEYLK